MKLRSFLLLTFFLVALIPSLLFWVWPYSKALDSEIDDVKERHLVIANNLAMAFDRYYYDVSSAFTALSSQLGQSTKNPSITAFLDVYDFQSVMLVSGKTGETIDCIIGVDKQCRSTISQGELHFAQHFAVEGKPIFSTVKDNIITGGDPVLLIVIPIGENFALGCLSTRYIVELGKKVSFGKKGHAAVIDQEANIMAHPRSDWVKQRKNISKVSVAQKMLAGKTGVATFFSPALNSDMIAGYTTVPSAGWGVMVPQPIEELQSKADTIDQTALLVMAIGLGIVLLIAIPVSFILTRPLERLSKATQAIGKKENFGLAIDIPDSKFLFSEVRKLNENFKQMIWQLKKNQWFITRLAYIDINTGLPNRNYFHKLTNTALKEAIKTNTKGAVLFIDLNEFKQVNDTYGHKAGDKILSLFSKRIMTHFSLRNIIENNDLWLNNENLPSEIPARLGGDEFVVLFQNIKDINSLNEKVEALLASVFGLYHLHEDVELMLSGSAGLALFPEHGLTYSHIIKAADSAMYEAKSSGEKYVTFSSTGAKD